MLRNAGHNIKGLKGIGSFTMTAAIVALSSVMGDIIKSQLPDDDDDLAEWLAVKSLLSPLSTIPVVRDGADVVEGQLLGKPFTSYRFTPAIQAIQKTLDIIPSTVKLAKGEKEWDDWTIGALSPWATPSASAELRSLLALRNTSSATWRMRQSMTNSMLP